MERIGYITGLCCYIGVFSAVDLYKYRYTLQTNEDWINKNNNILGNVIVSPVWPVAIWVKTPYTIVDLYTMHLDKKNDIHYQKANQ